MKRTLFNPVLVLSLLLAAIVAFLNVTSTLAQGNKVSLADSSTPTPTSTLRPPGSELDEDASLWGSYSAGNATGIVDNVADPSLDGRSLRCDYTGGDPYSAQQCYITLPAQPNAQVFTLSMSFFYRPASSPQALEFNMSKWDQNNRYQWALQWDNAGGTKWRYWDPANQWVDLGVSGPLAAEQWHTLVLQGEILNGKVHYGLFMLDGQAHDLDSTVEPGPPGGPDRLTVAVQLDGNDAPTPYELFVDHLLLNVAVPTPTLSSLKEISYYPKDYAWEQMWLHWPEAKIEMDQDLDRIQALGFNTVRIFLQPSAFGYPGVPNATQLGYFDEALALIDAHGLKAHVNLFDCWGDWGNISGSETWLMAIVAAHRDDPRIALWELKNEVIFDPSKPEYQTVRDWFQVLFPVLKAQVGNTPVTVSVYNVEWLADVKALSGATPPDIYSLHWYPNEVVWTDEFPRIIDRAHVLIDQAPLLIGEFGLSTYTYSDDLQADLATNVLYYAKQKGITNLGFWTLNDFPTNTLICCVMPKAEQWYYGLYRTDGTQKPAASIFQAAFHGNPPLHPSPRRALNNLSFEDLNPYSGQLYYWWPWDQDWTGQVWGVQDCTKAHTGKCSAKLHGPVGKDVGLYNILALPIDPGQRYNMEAYVWTENLDGSAWITFSWFDQYGAWISNTDSSPIKTPNSAGWVRISIDNAKPAQLPLSPRTAAYAEVFVKMHSNNQNSHVWFDDVKVSATFTSIAAQDGWVLESSENSNVGGSMNSTATTCNLGDDATKKQYRCILSFSTGAVLPDTAVITGVTLKFKQQAIVGGGNPVAAFGGFMFDVRNGFFGSALALQITDFQAPACATYGPTVSAPVGGWYSFNLLNAKSCINKLATGSGLTQIRLRFKLDDNNDAIANYLSLYSGNAPAGSQPQLVITYTVP